jgi:hypothetical protein
MKTANNMDNNYSLHNVDNFKSNLTCDVKSILDKYIKLVISYLKFVSETLKIKNKQYSHFIVVRGLDTLTHVFCNILYYTKNIELTYFHSQKAYYYYVEFIDQISEEQHSFLQLSSRDATTYVYKKTIYDINNEFRKNIEQTNKENYDKIDSITKHIKIFKTICYKFLKNYNGFLNMKEDDDNMTNIENILNKINALNINLESIQIFEYFILLLDNKMLANEEFIEILTLLIKKITKNTQIICKIKEKCHLEEFDNKLKEPAEKFITWLTEK